MAAVNGAFDVSIAIHRLPSFRNIRAMTAALQSECQFDYVYLTPRA